MLYLVHLHVINGRTLLEQKENLASVFPSIQRWALLPAPWTKPQLPTQEEKALSHRAGSLMKFHKALNKSIQMLLALASFN